MGQDGPGVFSLSDFALNWCFPECLNLFHSGWLRGANAKSGRSWMTKRPLGLPPCSAAVEPAGFTDISRGLSAAIPPENRIPKTAAPRRGASAFRPRTHPAHDPRFKACVGLPVVGAALDHRLMSVTAPRSAARNKKGATHNFSCAVLWSPQYFVRFPQHLGTGRQGRHTAPRERRPPNPRSHVFHAPPGAQ